MMELEPSSGGADYGSEVLMAGVLLSAVGLVPTQVFT